MGKKHTLKRAIERQPEIWFYDYYPDGVVIAHGAVRYSIAWVPQKWGSDRHSYEAFVAKTLRDLGYKATIYSKVGGRRSIR